MKKTFAAVALMSMGLVASAAEIKGFVEDTSCASKPAMKGDAECAASCIKRGSPAVLVTADGKVLKISNQDKIKSFAGKNVTVTGDVKDDTLTIDSVKE